MECQHNNVFIYNSGNNVSIEKLDLSWNNIRLKGGVSICSGIKVRIYVFNNIQIWLV